MISLTKGIEDDFVVVENRVISLKFLSFDVVLRFIGIQKEQQATPRQKEQLMLEFAKQFLIQDSCEDHKKLIQIVEAFYSKYLGIETVKNSERIALLETTQKMNTSPSMDFEEDADLIHASFLFDYNIDLLRERGRMHWVEFQSLLRNLSEESKLSRVIAIRQWESNEYTSEEEKKQMKRLKSIYKLGVTDEEISSLNGIEKEKRYMDSLSPSERREYALKKIREEEKNG